VRALGSDVTNWVRYVTAPRFDPFVSAAVTRGLGAFLIARSEAAIDANFRSERPGFPEARSRAYE
jgi:hypothetical protein